MDKPRSKIKTNAAQRRKAKQIRRKQNDPADLAMRAANDAQQLASKQRRQFRRWLQNQVQRRRHQPVPLSVPAEHELQRRSMDGDIGSLCHEAQHALVRFEGEREAAGAAQGIEVGSVPADWWEIGGAGVGIGAGIAVGGAGFGNGEEGWEDDDDDDEGGVALGGAGCVFMSPTRD